MTVEDQEPRPATGRRAAVVVEGSGAVAVAVDTALAVAVDVAVGTESGLVVSLTGASLVAMMDNFTPGRSPTNSMRPAFRKSCMVGFPAMAWVPS
ncbi:hypothetical protein AHiyo8_62270 [Arthrobacter sp. Hiyo8]|nr:hypothetical protein AHiyo8_62270 [Arthrobacter sp. Hiyo8]